MRNKKGFTLIEMMVAIVVLGIVSVLIASIFSSIIRINASTSITGDTRDDIMIIERMVRSVFEKYDTNDNTFSVSTQSFGFNSVDIERTVFEIKNSTTNTKKSITYLTSLNGLIFFVYDGDAPTDNTNSQPATFSYQCKGIVIGINFKALSESNDTFKFTIIYGADAQNTHTYEFVLTKRSEATNTY